MMMSSGGHEEELRMVEDDAGRGTSFTIRFEDEDFANTSQEEGRGEYTGRRDGHSETKGQGGFSSASSPSFYFDDDRCQPSVPPNTGITAVHQQRSMTSTALDFAEDDEKDIIITQEEEEAEETDITGSGAEEEEGEEGSEDGELLTVPIWFDVLYRPPTKVLPIPSSSPSVRSSGEGFDVGDIDGESSRASQEREASARSPKPKPKPKPPGAKKRKGKSIEVIDLCTQEPEKSEKIGAAKTSPKPKPKGKTKKGRQPSLASSSAAASSASLDDQEGVAGEEGALEEDLAGANVKGVRPRRRRPLDILQALASTVPAPSTGTHVEVFFFDTVHRFTTTNTFTFVDPCATFADLESRCLAWLMLSVPSLVFYSFYEGIPCQASAVREKPANSQQGATSSSQLAMQFDDDDVAVSSGGYGVTVGLVGALPNSEGGEGSLGYPTTSTSNVGMAELEQRWLKRLRNPLPLVDSVWAPADLLLCLPILDCTQPHMRSVYAHGSLITPIPGTAVTGEGAGSVADHQSLQRSNGAAACDGFEEDNFQPMPSFSPHPRQPSVRRKVYFTSDDSAAVEGRSGLQAPPSASHTLGHHSCAIPTPGIPSQSAPERHAGGSPGENPPEPPLGDNPAAGHTTAKGVVTYSSGGGGDGVAVPSVCCQLLYVAVLTDTGVPTLAAPPFVIPQHEKDPRRALLSLLRVDRASHMGQYLAQLSWCAGVVDEGSPGDDPALILVEHQSNSSFVVNPQKAASRQQGSSHSISVVLLERLHLYQRVLLHHNSGGGGGREKDGELVTVQRIYLQNGLLLCDCSGYFNGVDYPGVLPVDLEPLRE